MTAHGELRHILVVDDEAPVRMLLRECFELEGWHVVEAADIAAAMASLEAGPIDLVTLDLALAGQDGLELARRIRATRNVPIIMISGKGDTIDRVVGLELGADDYIAKPFHVREVLARARAVLRRYEGAAADAASARPGAPVEVWSFEGWTLDVGRRELTDAQRQPQPLTTAEFNLLLELVRRPGRVLSRDNIMDLLKGHDWSPLDRSIDQLVARLRRKIEAAPDTPRLVKTVRGVGYVFAAEASRH